MESTVEAHCRSAAIPAAVARYLDALELPPALAAQKSHARRLLARVRRRSTGPAPGLRSKRGRRRGDDRLGITGAFARSPRPARWSCSPARRSPTATTLLPDTHVAVVSRGPHRGRQWKMRSH